MGIRLSIAAFDPTRSVDWIRGPEAKIVAISFSCLSLLISSIHLVQHLRFYTMPNIQLYVVRILFVCPIYSVCSCTAMLLGAEYGAYAESIRDLFEAFVILFFLNLVLQYCGGETDCVYAIENEPSLRMPCPLCFLKPMPRDAKLLRFCQRAALQFVVVKPIMTVVDIILLATGYYFNIIWQILETIVYNLSYGIALYGLVLFYLATAQVIKRFRPKTKFISVKLIVFATYYQSLFIRLAPVSKEDAILWNDLVLCIEMVFFSLALWYAFPLNEYQLGMPDRRVLENLKEVFHVKDVYQGFQINFMPAYRDYALQGSQTEATETVRLRTYFAAGDADNVAMEMTERYRGKSKRMAFNSLLRGSKPIRAGLRRHVDDDNEESTVEFQQRPSPNIVAMVDEMKESKSALDVAGSTAGRGSADEPSGRREGNRSGDCRENGDGEGDGECEGDTLGGPGTVISPLAQSIPSEELSVSFPRIPPISIRLLKPPSLPSKLPRAPANLKGEVADFPPFRSHAASSGACDEWKAFHEDEPGPDSSTPTNSEPDFAPTSVSDDARETNQNMTKVTSSRAEDGISTKTNVVLTLAEEWSEFV